MTTPTSITYPGLDQFPNLQINEGGIVLGPDGKVQYVRYTACADPKIRDKPVGTIDPLLRTISLWDGPTPVVALTEDDTTKPTLSMFSEDGPPSVSQQRLDDFGEAIWAVYDLRQLWKSMGPKVETIRKEATPGRNDLCPCGSGKKFKKCHGA